MLPPGSPSPERIDGELTEPPPSDLSDYTWDDSETEQFHPAQRPRAAEPPVAAARAAPSALPDLERLTELLVKSQLIAESEIRSVCTRLSGAGRAPEALDVLDELIRREKLTRYQAAAIAQGKIKGLVIGNYVVLEKIGAGGMGLVLKARHKQLQRVVALKLLPPSISRDRSAVLRFRRETAAVARLRHPNIVAALDAGETHGLLFLVMEYVDGKDLAKFVREKGPLPVPQAVDCIVQAARGLAEAHAHGIIHRDIKPANLLRDLSGTIKVLDLGLARTSQGDNLLTSESADLDLTASGVIVGTVDYMSPEQAFDPRLTDARSDIYSLGCTLHYLLTGRPPYGGRTFMERLIGHREQPVPSLRRSRRDVHDRLDDLFRRMLSKSPGIRPQSLSELLGQLEAAMAPEDRTAAPPHPATNRSDDDTQEDPKSVYSLSAAARPVRTEGRSRPEKFATVFVRSRAPSSDRVENPRWRRRRFNERLVTSLMILGATVVFVWYLIRGRR